MVLATLALTCIFVCVRAQEHAPLVLPLAALRNLIYMVAARRGGGSKAQSRHARTHVFTHSAPRESPTAHGVDTHQGRFAIST